MDVAELSTVEHEALRKVFDRDHDGAFDFQAFVTRARRDAIMGCIMVPQYHGNAIVVWDVARRGTRRVHAQLGGEGECRPNQGMKGGEQRVRYGRTQPLYVILATVIDAYKRCEKDRGPLEEWRVKHRETLGHIERNLLPSGSGWDEGTRVLVGESTGEKLVLAGSFHHTNDVGMYDGWTQHVIRVRASLVHGITMTISGRNRNGVKDYLYELFESELRQPARQWYDDEAGTSGVRRSRSL